jgi:HTH-type transcriptional regulator/antitoxin HigA
MDLKPIRTEAEYEEALRSVEPYFDNEPDLGTPESDRFELLVMLIEAYESEHYPIGPPDPIEAIKFHMDQAGLTPKDLVPMIGALDVVNAVLDGTAELTLPMIRRLHFDLNIPAESLIAEPGRQPESKPV